MNNLFQQLKRSAVTFPLAVVTALLLMVISESSYRASVTQLDRLGEMGLIRTTNLDLLRQVLDAENGQRGYLITGRPEYLREIESQSGLSAVQERRANLHESSRPSPSRASKSARATSLAPVLHHRANTDRHRSDLELET